MASSQVLSAPSGISQSTWLAGLLIAGFLLWLAINGKLAAYWSLLLGGGAAASAPLTAAPTTATPPATATTPPANPATSGAGINSGPAAPASSPPVVTQPFGFLENFGVLPPFHGGIITIPMDPANVSPAPAPSN